MLKRFDSILLYIRNVNNSADFYKSIGFEISKKTESMIVAKLGDFEMHCHDQSTVAFNADSKINLKGTGVFIYIEVEDIDIYHKSLIDKRLKPSSMPRDWPWGNREFAIRDPDGYKIVFFQKIFK